MGIYLKSKKLYSFRPARISKRLYKIVKACTRYYSPATLRYYLFLASCLRLFVKGGFSVHQVFQLGFGSSFPSENKLTKYIGYHKMMRRKKDLTSFLEEIPGIGSIKSKKLLRYFGSLKKVKEASLIELSKAPALNNKDVRAVFEFLSSCPD